MDPSHFVSKMQAGHGLECCTSPLLTIGIPLWPQCTPVLKWTLSAEHSMSQSSHHLIMTPVTWKWRQVIITACTVSRSQHNRASFRWGGACLQHKYLAKEICMILLTQREPKPLQEHFLHCSESVPWKMWAVLEAKPCPKPERCTHFVSV